MDWRLGGVGTTGISSLLLILLLLSHHITSQVRSKLISNNGSLNSRASFFKLIINFHVNLAIFGYTDFDIMFLYNSNSMPWKKTLLEFGRENGKFATKYIMNIGHFRYMRTTSAAIPSSSIFMVTSEHPIIWLVKTWSLLLRQRLNVAFCQRWKNSKCLLWGGKKVLGARFPRLKGPTRI